MTLAQSDTVTLRRFSPDDLTDFQDYRNDPEVGRYQDWSLMADDEATKFLSYMAKVEPLIRPGHWTQIAVTELATGDLIGDIGLFQSEDENEAEIGITLARAHHRKGYGSAALSLGFELIWTKTKVQTIRAWADQRNKGSVALLHSVGMTHLGTENNDVIEEAFVLRHSAARVNH